MYSLFSLNTDLKKNYVGLPDFQNVLVSNPTYPYTATQKCWLLGSFVSMTSGDVVTVNGVVVAASRYSSGQYSAEGCVQIPLDDGDVVSIPTRLQTNRLSIVGIKS